MDQILVGFPRRPTLRIALTNEVGVESRYDTFSFMTSGLQKYQYCRFLYLYLINKSSLDKISINSFTPKTERINIKLCIHVNDT